MGKKTEERKRKQNEWLKWRWEFLRRNPEYREAYFTKVLKLRKACHIDPEVPKEIGNGKVYYPYFQTEECQKEKDLSRQFGAYSECIINPDLSFEEIINGLDCLEKAAFYPSTFWSHFAEYHLNGSHLILDIDLSKVNSFRALMEESGKLLEIILTGLLKSKKIRKHFHPGAQELRLSKDYQTVLDTGEQVLAIKQEPHFTFEKAAKIIYPGLFKKNEESTKKRVEKEFKDYQHLIDEGGYREITFP
jgi:hypothetical protein